MNIITGLFRGIKHAFDGVKGSFELVGGVLTANPALLKAGARDFEQGLALNPTTLLAMTVIEMGGDGASADPLGVALNAIAHGAAHRLLRGD